MGNLLFSPSGRVNPDEFMRAAYVLVAVTFLINLMPMVSVALGSILKLLVIVTLYCWTVLFIKRYRDGGKSGWWVFAPIVVFLIAAAIHNAVVPGIFAPDLYAEMQSAIEEATMEGSFVGIIAASKEYAEPLAKKIALPSSAIYAVMSLAIAFVFNAMIKHDPQDNEFGPAR